MGFFQVVDDKDLICRLANDMIALKDISNSAKSQRAVGKVIWQYMYYPYQ